MNDTFFFDAVKIKQTDVCVKKYLVSIAKHFTIISQISFNKLKKKNFTYLYLNLLEFRLFVTI